MTNHENENTKMRDSPTEDLTIFLSNSNQPVQPFTKTLMTATVITLITVGLLSIFFMYDMMLDILNI